MTMRRRMRGMRAHESMDRTDEDVHTIIEVRKKKNVLFTNPRASSYHHSTCRGVDNWNQYYMHIYTYIHIYIYMYIYIYR